MDVNTLYNGCNYISMLGLKLIHVNKRIHRYNANCREMSGNFVAYLLKRHLVNIIMDVSTLYNGCKYISMLGLKLIHVNKRIPWYKIIFVLTSTNWPHISCTSSIYFDWWAEWVMKKHCLVVILWNVAEHQMYKYLSHINSSKAKSNLLIWIPSTKTIIWNMWSYMFWARWWPDARSSYKRLFYHWWIFIWNNTQ